jgi:hypothetical protein
MLVEVTDLELNRFEQALLPTVHTVYAQPQSIIEHDEMGRAEFSHGTILCAGLLMLWSRIRKARAVTSQIPQESFDSKPAWAGVRKIWIVGVVLKGVHKR